MSKHICKSHSVTALLYRLVCPTDYRQAIITDEVDALSRCVPSVKAQLWGGAF